MTHITRNSQTPHGATLPAHNPFNEKRGRLGQPTPFPITAQPNTAQNPLFGRPIWTYVRRDSSPVAGPQPRLAKGTGRTGDPELPGNAASLPGYLSDNEYFPSEYYYQPIHNPHFRTVLPRSIQTGNDGIELLGTYRAHDFTPADRFLDHMRQAANWQVMVYPPDYRNLLAWQQVMKYRVESLTISPRPLNSSNYFLGYQVNPQLMQDLGQSGLGYMGSQ